MSRTSGVFPVSRVHSPTALGMFLTNNDVTCDEVTGSINIRALALGEDGHPTGLNASMTVYCNGSAVPFKATIRHKL